MTAIICQCLQFRFAGLKLIMVFVLIQTVNKRTLFFLCDKWQNREMSILQKSHPAVFNLLIFLLCLNFNFFLGKHIYCDEVGKFFFCTLCYFEKHAESDLFELAAIFWQKLPNLNINILPLPLNPLHLLNNF